MELFNSRLLFEIDIEGAAKKQYSEELYLVKASNEFEAFHQCQTKGQTESETFKNKFGRNVKWKFVGVVDLVKLNINQRIIQLDSKTIEPDSPREYLNGLRDKFDKILQSYLYPVPN